MKDKRKYKIDEEVFYYNNYTPVKCKIIDYDYSHNIDRVYLIEELFTDSNNGVVRKSAENKLYKRIIDITIQINKDYEKKIQNLNQNRIQDIHFIKNLYPDEYKMEAREEKFKRIIEED